MNSEVRFILAIVLMLGVLVGTNFLFPPTPQEESAADSTAVRVDTTGGAEVATETDPVIPGGTQGDSGGAAPEAVEVEPAAAVDSGEGAPEPDAPPIPAGATPEIPDQETGQVVELGPDPTETGIRSFPGVLVRGPLYRFTFSLTGARLSSAELVGYESFQEEGPVNLVPSQAEGYLGNKVVVGQDTVDLSRVRFRAEPEDGLVLEEGGEAQTLRLIYEHPTQPFRFEVAYTFEPDVYAVSVQGRVTGLNRPLVVTRLGQGLAYTEADSAQEARSMAYVVNHVSDGITSWNLDETEPRVVEGPIHWAAFRSKFFVLALLAQDEEGEVVEGDWLGGMLVGDGPMDDRAEVQVTQSPAGDGSFAYRLFMGPQEYARLASLGEDMEEVNPYGWRFFRPIIRPFVSIIITALTFLHDTLSIGYGWVLIIFGVGMRVLLFPLNHKAMKAQLRNMAVQPLVKQIQERHKENPEKLQKEMMKLYKDHGFNPVAGCLPMLLPWPILIALFFVFQNAIEFRGVPFLWLPDLSAADPLFILPLFLGLSMFLMQYVSLKSLDEPNPQMKMMMWIMPGMMVFIFFNLPSGLNLYYATVNIATIPQQVWIANERKKVKPVTLSDD